MNLPENRFKRALPNGASRLVSGAVCRAATSPKSWLLPGFDWLLFDTEHSPGDVLTVLPQLQAVAAYDVSAIVRPASNDAVLIKRYLDIGAQTLLIPYVQNREEAETAVAAMRYPPDGVRGVSGLTRATRFGRVAGYAKRADEELCLLVQLETRRALEALEAIATVDGVDGVFIGPADLAASLGFPESRAIRKLSLPLRMPLSVFEKAGKPSGILTPNAAFAHRCISLGTTFTAVGIDAGILARGTEGLARQFQEQGS